MIISGKVKLPVADIDESIHFYIFVLGLLLKERRGNISAVIENGDLSLFLEQQFYRGFDVLPNKNST